MGWFWSVANWSVKILVVSLMLISLTGIETSLAIKGALSGELSALLPITGPAGLGTYEAGVWSGTGLPWLQMKGLMSGVFLTHVFFLLISLSAALLALIAGGFNSQFLTVPQVHENDSAVRN